MKKNIHLIYFLLLCTISLVSQNENIPLLKSAISIDGKLDEIVWEKALLLTDFNNFYPNDQGKATNDTEVRIFHDGITIYISAIYHDSSKTKVVGSLKRDEHYGSLILSDAFGIVIDAFNKNNNGYYFTVNASSTQLDALVLSNGTDYEITTSWNTIWEAKTSTVGNDKIYEIAIPFKAINYDINNPTWGFQFFSRDVKTNLWMTLTDLSVNNYQFDLRFTKKLTFTDLPKNNISKFTLTPSITSSYQDNLIENKEKTVFKPSLDVQYNLTSSLRLGATINPDFSQIEVDRQVTNLTRFEIGFPERRNFFLENSDLFTKLGPNDVNPFYSRIIGADSDIQFGLKLSGNITPKTRIGILDVQTKKNENSISNNFSAMVVQHQLSKNISVTGFLINRQETAKFNFKKDYNRIVGLNLNYKSNNNKWITLSNFGKSYSQGIATKNTFYNTSIRYSTRKIAGNISLKNVAKNYITDIGFVPRLYNFDAINNQIVREGFTKSETSIAMYSFPKSDKIDQFRYFNPSNSTYWNENGVIIESASDINQTLWFKSSSSVFLNLNHNYENLKYSFDPLGNGKAIEKGIYNFTSFNLGYNSVNNKKIHYSSYIQYGNYYKGNLIVYHLKTTFKFLPIAKIGLDYEMNKVNLKKLGRETFHLARFSGEIFFSNKLNWTTYVQYNNQFNNFNVNSRLQWEYKPLSYIYFVVTDNYNKKIARQNWGASLKVNYRFDL